ncbi:MAG: hypothetical protein V4819_03480 [Verrucomicrobiota bacterium]
MTLTTDPNKRGCEVEVANVGPDGAPGDFRPMVFSSSRNIIIIDLIPGKRYVYRGRMLRGSTTHSDWSDPITQRAA